MPLMTDEGSRSNVGTKASVKGDELRRTGNSQSVIGPRKREGHLDELLADGGESVHWD
jgi:hypothetical protein